MSFAFNDPLNGICYFQNERKVKRIYNKKSSEKIKRWTTEESQLYEDFITKYNNIFEEANNKRLTKIFVIMSKFIRSKDSNQCRSHHQKFYKKIMENQKKSNDFSVKQKKKYKKKDNKQKDFASQSNLLCKPSFLMCDVNNDYIPLQQENESVQTMDESYSYKPQKNKYFDINSNDSIESNQQKKQENFKTVPVDSQKNEEPDYFKDFTGEDILMKENSFSDLIWLEKKDDGLFNFVEENIGKYFTEEKTYFNSD